MRSAPCRLSLAFAAALLLASACGDDDTDDTEDATATTTSAPTSEADDGANDGDSEWETLLADAEAEGAVVLYASGNPQAFEQLTEAFEAAHPEVQLEFLVEGSTQIAERIEGERSAGAVGGDVVLLSNEFFMQDELAAGRATPMVLAPDNESLAASCVEEGGYLNAYVSLAGVGYNTNLVPDPQSLDDFVGMRGSLNDPATAAPASFIYETLGWDWLEDVSSSEAPISIKSNAGETLNAIGSEEEAWGIVSSPQVAVVRAEGAPVDLFLADPTPGFMTAAVALTDAPHPAAAQVLLNFIISLEGQEVLIGDGGGMSCRDDVPNALEPPSDVVLLAREHVEPDFLAERRSRFDALFR